MEGNPNRHIGARCERIIGRLGVSRPRPLLRLVRRRLLGQGRCGGHGLRVADGGRHRRRGAGGVLLLSVATGIEGHGAVMRGAIRGMRPPGDL